MGLSGSGAPVSIDNIEVLNSNSNLSKFSIIGSLNVDISDSEFRDNATPTTNSNLINIRNASSLDIQSCEFEHNTTNGSGGSIATTGVRNVNVESTSFQFDSSAIGGSIAFVSGDSVSIENCTFDNNFARVQGGGAHILNYANVSILNTDFRKHF